MLTFSPLRTARLQVELRELPARDAIALCQMPPNLTERGTTELLRRIVIEPETTRRGQETDHRLWSVQERAMVVSHYLAHMLEGDFAIGNVARYSDYLLDSLGAPPGPVSLGEVGGQQWSMQPLLGWHAESIERLIQSEELEANYTGWLVGAMAAQVYTAEQGPLDCFASTDVLIDQALTERAQALTALPESVFMALVRSFNEALPRLDHCFSLTIGDDGIAFQPVKEVPGNVPARFLFSSAVREDTAAVFGPAA